MKTRLLAVLIIFLTATGIQAVDTTNAACLVPVEREIEVPRGRWVTERKVVPSMRTVYEKERYTTYVTKYKTRCETRTRQVRKTVRDYEVREVNETVYDEVCDPVTGVRTRVPRTVCRTERVPVKRTICVDQPYTVKVRVPVQVPVTRTRRVPRQVPCTREVCERRWVVENVRERCVSMEPAR